MGGEVIEICEHSGKGEGVTKSADKVGGEVRSLVILWKRNNWMSPMQFFQRRFAVTSVMKIYTKMWELWLHNAVKVSEKKPSIFLFWNLLTFFKVGEIMVPKYGHLMLSGHIRIFLFCRKVMFRSQDIQVFVFLTIPLPNLWRHGEY